MSQKGGKFIREIFCGMNFYSIIIPMPTYQMASFFRIDEAIAAAAKAALLAAKIKGNKLGKIEVFNSGIKKDECLIEVAEFNFLNKLPVEPLFYWNKIFKTLKEAE